MNKTCRYCVTEKPIEKFYRNAESKDGYQNKCISCDNKARTKRFKMHREIKEWSKGKPHE